MTGYFLDSPCTPCWLTCHWPEKIPCQAQGQWAGQASPSQRRRHCKSDGTGRGCVTVTEGEGRVESNNTIHPPPHLVIPLPQVLFKDEYVTQARPTESTSFISPFGLEKKKSMSSHWLLRRQMQGWSSGSCLGTMWRQSAGGQSPPRDSRHRARSQQQESAQAI